MYWHVYACITCTHMYAHVCVIMCRHEQVYVKVFAWTCMYVHVHLLKNSKNTTKTTAHCMCMYVIVYVLQACMFTSTSQFCLDVYVSSCICLYAYECVCIMYVHVYVCLYEHVRRHVHACVIRYITWSACMCMYACMCWYVCMSMRVHEFWVCACMYVCACMCLYVLVMHECSCIASMCKYVKMVMYCMYVYVYQK